MGKVVYEQRRVCGVQASMDLLGALAYLVARLDLVTPADSSLTSLSVGAISVLTS